jgi:nucleotide-binding universal stress UspA family protein
MVKGIVAPIAGVRLILVNSGLRCPAYSETNVKRNGTLQQEATMFKHILVPTDGSELSQEAARRAVAFAKETGARVTAFYARPEYPVAYYGEGALIDPTTPEKFAELADHQAEQVLGFVADACAAAGVECDQLALTSDVPYEAIIEAAGKSGCDLIFMASHGRRGISSLLLGSETNKVLTHSKIPVLVYR